MSGTVADALRELRFGPFQALALAAIVAGSVYLLTTPYYLLALVPGPLLLALSLLGRQPQFAFYLFVFLIPFEFLTRLSSTRSELTVSKFLGAWIVLVSLFMLLVHRWRAQHLKSSFWPFLAVFVLINLVSALNSNHPATVATELRQLLVAITVFALALLLTTRRGFQRIIPTVLIWSVLLNYAIFLLEFRFGVALPWAAAPIFRQDVSLPSYALPTAYSLYFVFLLPFLLHRFFFSEGFARKALYATLSALAVSGILYLGSRAAFVVTLFLIALLGIQYLRLLRPRQIGFLLAGVFICAALVTMFAPEWYVARQKTMFETKTEESVSMRIAFLKAGWEFFKQQPLLGFGPGAFADEYATTLYSASFVSSYQGYRMRSHNTYLEVLIGSGLPALLCFLVLCGLALRNFRIAARSAVREGDLSRRLLVSAYQAAFLVNLLFFFFISHLTMKHFWIFLALSQVARNISESPPRGAGEAA